MLHRTSDIVFVCLPRDIRSVALLRRHKLRISHPAASGRHRSLRCSSSPQKVIRLFGGPDIVAKSYLFR